MCKRGGVPHSNECQFYVTMGSPLQFMDDQTVVFGRVIEGFRVFKMIEKCDTVNEYPNPPIIIQETGIHSMEKKIMTSKSKAEEAAE